MKNSWEEVKRFYVERFKVDPQLVELVAISDVLLLSVSGSSNLSISHFLNIDLKDILEILDTVLDFEGWKEDLNLNPYSVYLNLITHNQLTSANFVREIYAIDSCQKIDCILLMYRVCSIYYGVERRIDQEWV